MGDADADVGDEPDVDHDMSIAESERSAQLGFQANKVAAALFGEAPPAIDRFEVRGVLGAGASAVVYRAFDPVLGREVALKLASETNAPDAGDATDAADAACRQRREARVLAQLTHPNVVQVYEAGQWQGRSFLVMELIEGATLAEHLAERRGTAEILRVMAMVARGLAAAHARGIVHRDVKPSNVMVTRDATRVVVTDFGLVGRDVDQPASDTSESARTTPVGTPAYVAPEQRAGAAAHPSADVYSFALMVVEALLGERPRPESDARWRSAVRKLVPQRLAAELARALEPDPQRRAQSLEPLLTSMAPVPRRRWRWAAAGLVAGTLVAGQRESRPTLTIVEAPLLGDSVEARLDEQRRLLAVPKSSRDAAWIRGARALAMTARPTEIPCIWPTPPRDMAILDDAVLAVDASQRLWSCSLADAQVDELPGGGVCLRRSGWGGRVAVVRPSGAIDLFGARVASSMQTLRATPSSVPRFDDAYACSRYVLSAYDQASVERFVTRLKGRDARHRVSGGALVLTSTGTLSFVPSSGGPRVVATGVKNAMHDAKGRRVLVMNDSEVALHDLVTSEVLVRRGLGPLSRRGGLWYLSAAGDLAILQHGGDLMWWREGAPGLSRFSGAAPILAAAASPTGQRIAGLTAEAGGSLEVRDLVSHQRFEIGVGAFEGIGFCGSPDCVIAYDSIGAVYQWSLEKVRSRVISDHELRGKSSWGLAPCPDEMALPNSTSSEDDRYVRIPSLDARPLLSLPIPEGSAHALRCANGRVIVGTTASRIYVFDLQGRLIDEIVLKESYRWIWQVAELAPPGQPPGHLIGTGYSDEPDGYMGPAKLLWARGGQLVELASVPKAPQANTGVVAILVTADGRYAAATTSVGQLVILDAIRGSVSEVRHERAKETRATLLDGDKLVVTGGADGVLRVTELATGHVRRTIEVGRDAIYRLQRVPGTFSVVVAYSTGKLQRWDVASGVLQREYQGHVQGIARIELSDDGRWMATSDLGGRVCVRAADSAECTLWLEGHEVGRAIHGLDILRDGRVLTFSNDGTLRLWRPTAHMDADTLATELEGYLFRGPHVVRADR